MIALQLALAGCDDQPGRATESNRATVDAGAPTVDAAFDARTAPNDRTPEDAASSNDAANSNDGANSNDAGTDTGWVDAGGSCSTHTDCQLVNRSCCAPCSAPTKSDVMAVTEAEARTYQPQCTGAVCGSSCPISPPYDPLGPKVHAACVSHRCTVVDLREEELTRCNSDAECEPVSTSCCPLCFSDPKLTSVVGARKGADAAVLACFPVPPCVSCSTQPPVVAVFPYCAADGHCALRVTRP